MAIRSLMKPKGNWKVGHLFEYIYELGSGTFGRVLKVRHNLDKGVYALKIISLEGINGLNSDMDDILKIKNEVKIMSRLSDIFAVKYYQDWIDENCLYIQMEFCSDNLKNKIKQKTEFFMREESEPMNTIEYFISCQLFKELLECVQYLHQSNPAVIHRDLKPENILISENIHCNRVLKLADFGLAILIKNNTLALTEYIGTPSYMAPETQLRPNGKSRYSTKTDVFALSFIAQELFDFDFIDSSDNEIIENEMLRLKWMALQTQIEGMSIRQYKQRPNCSDILSKYREWVINPDELINSEEYQINQMIFNDIEQDNFFIKYLNAKLK